MEIAIANVDKTPTWYIVGTDIFLSFENPGPITVDAKKLTTDQVNTIRNAATANIIVAKGLDELVTVAPKVNKPTGKSYSNMSQDVYKAATPVAVSAGLGAEVITKEEVTAAIAGPKEGRKKEIKALLNKPLFTAKKNLMGMSIQDLRLALEVENEAKGRKSVIDVINDMINKFNGEVSSHIANNVSEYTVKEKPLSPQLTEIEETDTESVEVDLGDTADK